ncbi:crt-like protein 1-like isoform X2 [Hibiscus syriacus]|uniref:Crt-like protein 1-like isoform X2 n=1 Tax=Hibiscus syriacus TaxID=106335 RepID=A0A6A2XBF7_HIBSY|nr:crt-like protein 1-like isoform X2 [Hibiscus syriacus]
MSFSTTSSFRSLPSHLATSTLLNSNSAKLQSPILMSLPQKRSSFHRQLNRSTTIAPPKSSVVIRPNLTVRALSKTPSPAADAKLIAICSSVTITFAVANRILYKLSLVPMKEYPFFLAQFTTFGYVMIYFSILFIRYRAGIVTNEMLGLPKSRFAAIGMLEALGVASGMASAAMLPGPAIPILNQSFLVWQLVFSAVLLGSRYSFNQIGGCLLVAVGVIIAVTRYVNAICSLLPIAAPVACSGSDTGQMLPGIKFMWPGLMIISAAFQAGASIIKEFIFLDAAKRHNAKSLDIFVVNSFGSGFQALFALLLLPLLSNLKGIPFFEFPSYLKGGDACFLKLGCNTPNIRNRVDPNHPDEWKTIDLFALGLYGLIIFPTTLGCIDAAVVELFEQLPRRVNPAPTILAETFRSLNHCRRTGGGRFIGCVQLLQVWIHSHFWKTNGVAYRRFSTTYSPLGEFITMKWHEDASKEEWMKVFIHLQDRDITWRAPWLFLSDVLFRFGDSDTMTLLGLWGAVGYAPLLALRQYGARQFIPATYGLSTSEFVYHGDSYKKRIKEAAESWKKVSRMDVVAARDMLTPDYIEWRRLRKNDSILMPDCEDTRTMEEHLRPVPSELEIVKAEFEAVNNEMKQRVKELEWRFRWEQAQQRVKDRDVLIRDFLDQVQKAACHLHGLAREAGVVQQDMQPVTDENRRLVNLLEAVRGLEDLV